MLPYCLYNIWWLPKELLGFVFYCSMVERRPSNNTETVFSSIATLLRRTNRSVEWRRNSSDTFAIKFGCKRTSISFNFTYKLIFGDGVACTKEMLKQRDLVIKIPCALLSLWKNAARFESVNKYRVSLFPRSASVRLEGFVWFILGLVVS